MNVVDRRDLGRNAAKAALRLRMRLRVPSASPLCPFDVADQLGIDVWLRSETSLEGIYVKDPTSIIVSNCRPPGRRRYNCAHELGHHEFNHGTRVDLLDSVNRDDPEEVLADSFAGHLMMPVGAVRQAFTDRQWQPDRLEPLQALQLAHQFGVGYTTFLAHASLALGLVSPRHANLLKREKPIDLRSQVIGFRSSQPAYLLDAQCASKTIDVEVGDFVVVPKDCITEGVALQPLDERSARRVLVARKPGVARVVYSGENASFVRVARAGFAGLARFRHLEEENDG
ncbi:MAG: hypothetical protein ICCCNLDF_03584 [Planctomycetes bacterium]|nr:hypothetical protein [Planctomycetota bacterium]